LTSSMTVSQEGLCYMELVIENTITSVTTDLWELLDTIKCCCPEEKYCTYSKPYS